MRGVNIREEKVYEQNDTELVDQGSLALALDRGRPDGRLKKSQRWCVKEDMRRVNIREEST